MLQQLIAFLHQPYPDKDDFRSIVIGSLVTGLIVIAILILFIPFGLNEVGGETYKYAVLFGCISCVTVIVFESIQKYILGIRKDQLDWVFWKWLISTLLLVLCIAIANYAYVNILFGDEGYDTSFSWMLRNTIAVGIFPIVGFGSFNLIKNLKANQDIASKIVHTSVPKASTASVALPIKNSTKSFELAVDSIIYVEAMQNYVSICYRNTDNSISKELHRNTISAVEEALNDHQIKRCHRSFLVNPSKIQSVSGNAQGLKLHFEEIDDTVPVSRKYIKEFR